MRPASYASMIARLRLLHRDTHPRLHVFDFCTVTRILRINICTSSTSAPQHASSSLTLEIQIYSGIPSSLILAIFVCSVFPLSANTGQCNILSFTLKWLVNRESTNGINQLNELFNVQKIPKKSGTYLWSLQHKLPLLKSQINQVLPQIATSQITQQL